MQRQSNIFKSLQFHSRFCHTRSFKSSQGHPNPSNSHTRSNQDPSRIQFQCQATIHTKFIPIPFNINSNSFNVIQNSCKNSAMSTRQQLKIHSKTIQHQSALQPKSSKSLRDPYKIPTRSRQDQFKSNLIKSRSIPIPLTLNSNSIEIHSNSCNSIQIHSNPFKFMQLHSNPFKSIRTHATPVKAIQIRPNSCKSI